MASQRKRNPNGAGTITKRKDGRFQAAVYVLQPDGTRARKFAYGKTWAECDTKRRDLLAKVDQGVPVPTRSAKLSEWLPYWLDNVIKPRRKLSTYDKYESHVRLYLVPFLGAKTARIPRASRMCAASSSGWRRKPPLQRPRNPPRPAFRSLLGLPRGADHAQRRQARRAARTDNRELNPWTLDETLDFLAASRRDPLYAAFVLAIAHGPPPGRDHRSPLVGPRPRQPHPLRPPADQRRRGVLYDDDPKSRRRRIVPLPALCIAPLRWHRMRQSAAAAKAGEQWHESGYVFTTRTGRPVEPRNVYRSFTRVAESAGLRVIRLHDARHGTRHPPHGGRSRAPRRDGDPRAQPDQHHHGRLHARRPGHPARSHQPHGPAAQEAARSASDRPR